jgi:hypothetical protein
MSKGGKAGSEVGPGPGSALLDVSAKAGQNPGRCLARRLVLAGTRLDSLFL